jgi:hypothetical protein
MKKLFLCTICFLLAFNSLAQDVITQSVRGTVVDSESKFPMIGAKIKVVSITDKVYGAICDVNGNFEIKNVPIGKQILEVKSIGYETREVTVIVNAGKESILNILMEEQAIQGKEVIVTGRRKGEVINEMASVSTQKFSVEETDRYAGSRGDPARMMSNYAGASGTDDSRNDLVIRGNSPLGIQYRIEGVAIPNPSHFAIAGSTGGPVSILNNKFLDNSDFFMSAFPAEYGNSTSGVFDLRLRAGNNKRHEFTGQFGFLGTEVLFEGPLSKNGKASYLIMGRYSTLTLMDKIGIQYGTAAVPTYGDGAIKLNFPMKKGGQISLWSMGGASEIQILISDQEEPDTELFGAQDRDQYFGSQMVTSGLTYKKPINKKTFFKATASYAYQNQHTDHRYIIRDLDSVTNKWNYDPNGPFNMMGYEYKINTFSGYAAVNQKLNSKHLLKYGFNVDAHTFNMTDSIRTDITTDTSDYMYRWNYANAAPAVMVQPFVQWKWKASKKLTLNAGVHSQYFSFSNSLSPVEPRVGMKYTPNEKSVIGLGGGLHTQAHPLYIYTYSLSGDDQLHNQNIDFSKSIHTVLSYQTRVGKSMVIKSEVYYQYLYNIPVERQESAFSMVNQGSGFNRFYPDSLVNDGVGYNMGAELTVQKFFDNSFYFMTTLSVYDSKYRGSDGVERNTDFNGTFVSNALIGKEWTFGEQDKHKFALGSKITYAGGKRYGDVDSAATNALKEIVYKDENYNGNQFANYFRLDAKINYTFNSKKTTHEFGLDLVNILGTKNILGKTYAPQNTDVNSDNYLTTDNYQLGFLPIFYYKIDFKLAGKK